MSDQAHPSGPTYTPPGYRKSTHRALADEGTLEMQDIGTADGSKLAPGAGGSTKVNSQGEKGQANSKGESKR